MLHFLFSVMTCILSVWIERNGSNPVFSFGYERFEVLAVFASTVLAQLGSLFIVKESIERLVLEQPEIHT
jgi:zinc transporter 6